MCPDPSETLTLLGFQIRYSNVKMSDAIEDAETPGGTRICRGKIRAFHVASL